ncbi:fibronectin type III-like domain-contianing protein [Cutibacterium acnes]
MTWADKELKGFTRIHVPPHDSSTCHLEIPVDQCSIIDSTGKRVIPTGPCEILIGHSSKDDDLISLSFTIDGATTPTRSSTTEEL